MNKKRIGRLAVLCAIVLFFASFNLWVYATFTARYVNDYSDKLKAKSIELDRYLPFAEETGIVKADASLRFTAEDFAAGNLPVIDGAAALYPVFSAFVHATYPEEAVSFDGTDFTENSCLRMNNTIKAYREVVDGDADIVLCAPPSEEQMAYAKERGVELQLTPVGREAFVFFVNENNPVENLTLAQLRAIYSGEIKNWKEVGGLDAHIESVQRNAGSGSQTAFLKVMGDTKPMRFYVGLPGSAIGFSFRYYVEDVVEEGGVKLLALEGYAPTKENIINGDYPIVSEFYAVTRADNPNENVRRFVEWMTSEEAQQIVEKTGYVRLE